MCMHADRHQCVSASIVMIKSACKPLTIGDSEIELKLVSASGRWIRPCGVGDDRTTAVEIELAFPLRQNARGSIEKSRELGERDRFPVIEVARRVTLAP